MSKKQERVNKALNYVFDGALDRGLTESSLGIAHSMIVTIDEFAEDKEDTLIHFVDNWKDYIRKSVLN